ncbi:MAG: alpha/beta fold hydrolase [Proteobacteria bacterium]|nr:alpha/beta fold hydrolase [Pseudomonadota bacterium]
MKRKHSIHTASRLGWDIARESAASILTYELYPLGLISKSLPTLPTISMRRHEPKLPVLFIHGIFHNRSTFAWLKQRLYSKGFRHFKEVNLLTSIHPIPRLAEQVARESRLLVKKFQVPQIDIVAHSMGGMIARYFVQLLGGDGLVRNLITLGTPHRGTEWSKYSLIPHIRELAPQSRTIELLNQCPPPKYTRAVAVSGDLDIVIRPKDCTWWEGVRNIHLSRVGHAGLLFSKRVLEITLSHLDEESPDLPLTKNVTTSSKSRGRKSFSALV